MFYLILPYLSLNSCVLLVAATLKERSKRLTETIGDKSIFVDYIA